MCEIIHESGALGIPSGWEEIAAFVELSQWSPKMDGYAFEIKTGFIPPSYRVENAHDWRILP